MPLEAATYIHQLDPANPAAPDLMADTDNHLRLIKETLKNTFPNVTGAVTASQSVLNGGVPIGGIILWSGKIADIPAGWVLCAGQTGINRSDGQGTIAVPDLRSKFIVGAGQEATGTDTALYKVGSSGGAIQQTGTTDFQGTHYHTGSTDYQGSHSHGGGTGYHTLTVAEIPPHDHTTSVNYGSCQVAYNGVNAWGYNGQNGTTSFTTGQTGGGSGHNHPIALDGSHAHSVTTQNAGSHQHNITVTDGRPPWFALALIMKV